MNIKIIFLYMHFVRRMPKPTILDNRLQVYMYIFQVYKQCIISIFKNIKYVLMQMRGLLDMYPKPQYAKQLTIDFWRVNELLIRTALINRTFFKLLCIIYSAFKWFRRLDVCTYYQFQWIVVRKAKCAHQIIIHI